MVPVSTPSSSSISTQAEKIKQWEEQVKLIEEEEKNESSVEALFRRIYASSSEETRRAMNKSFQESNGTVLSTDWNEVKKGVVSVKPPESSEFKKW